MGGPSLGYKPRQWPPESSLGPTTTAPLLKPFASALDFGQDAKA